VMVVLRASLRCTSATSTLAALIPPPYLIDDFSGAEYVGIGPNQLQFRLLNGGLKDLFVVVAVGRCKGLHDEAGVPGFDGNF
jgi:hypothetical protein